MRKAASLLAFTLACADSDDGGHLTGLDATSAEVSAPGDSDSPDTRGVGTGEDASVLVDSSASDVAEPLPDASAPVDTAADGVAPGEDAGTPGCEWLPPQHTRVVMISKPYSESGGKADAWETRALLQDGALGEAQAFTMSRAVSGVVAFRHDGGLAAAVDDHGEIHLIALTATGVATPGPTVDPELVYAQTAAFAPDGLSLIAVDPNWPENGGGLFRVSVGCEGDVGEVTALTPSKLALTALPLGDRWVVPGRGVGSGPEGQVHLVGADGALLASAKVFPDTDDILASATLTADRRFVLVGDHSEFSGLPNRIGVARIDGDTLEALAPVTPVLDPVALVASPLGDSVLVVSGYGNAVRVVGYSADAEVPFVDLGEPEYLGASPALPGDAVLVPGEDPVVLVVENVAVRSFRFVPGGVVDLGASPTGSGFTAIPGAIGVQPL